MLHTLELENFKAFGERARIPFAPITLIFGENSAGKSTILQALNLLKQTLESRESAALLLPRDENGIVDLGSFQEMLFNHDLKRTLSIRVESEKQIRAGDAVPARYSGHKKNKAALEFSFKRSSVEEEVILEQIGIYDAVSDKCLAKFQPLDGTEDTEDFPAQVRFLVDSVRSSGFPVSKLNLAKCVWVTSQLEYWKSEFEWCKKNKEEIRHELKEELTKLERSNEGPQEGNKKFEKRLKSLKDSIKFLSSDFALKNYIVKRHNEEMKTVIELRSFRPYISFEGNSWVTSLRALLDRRKMLGDTEIFDFNPVGLTMAVGGALEQTLEMLYPMSPFRRAPERWYIFRGTSPQNVGYRGDLLPDLLFRHHELVEETNEWLKRLEIDYELEVKPVGTDSGDLFEVRLIDTRRKERVSVALPDVGFGVSQLLPFIVQSLVSEERIISIEQPEVHVHPKLQADLGDLLAAAIKEPRHNHFILETHSEHLILRLQRLVYEKHIEPEDISVIYVSRGSDGSEVQRLHLDEEGDFIDEWPNGFFPERLRELR